MICSDELRTHGCAHTCRPALQGQVGARAGCAPLTPTTHPSPPPTAPPRRAKWAHVLAAPAYDGQRRFCVAVMNRLVRLSYWDRILSILPEEFRCVQRGSLSFEVEREAPCCGETAWCGSVAGIGSRPSCTRSSPPCPTCLLPFAPCPPTQAAATTQA